MSQTTRTPLGSRASRASRASFASLGLLAALTLTACTGESTPSLEEIWPEVDSSIQDATSVDLDGTVSQQGRQMDISLAGQIDDASYAGHFSMDGAEVDVIGNAEYTYMKPNTRFYEELGSARLQDMVGERWLELPAGQGGWTMSGMWESVLADIPSAEDIAGTEFTAETVELEGEEAYRYSGTPSTTGQPIVLYISPDHRLLRMEASAAPSGAPSESGTATESGAATPSGEATPSAAASGSGEASPSGTATSAASGGPATAQGTEIDFADWNAVEPVEMPTGEDVFSVPGGADQ